MKRFCGFAVGFIFFISGLLKLMDPVGTGLIMKEYFKFLHIGFMDFSAQALGVVFALAEAIIGAGLVTGVWKKTIGLAAIFMQGFFTLLTVALVIFNPEMDCGCFGEAIHLTHWQTFIKNLILLGLLLAYYIPKKSLKKPRPKKHVSFGLVCLSTIAFTIYSLLYIPMADFTALKPGTAINQESYASDVPYEAAFVYSKDGVEEVFDLENLPDTTWTFVRTETIGATPVARAANTISISDADGQYADSLLTEGKIMVLSIYRSEISAKDSSRIVTFAKDALSCGFRPVVLSATEDLKLPAEISQYHCDYKTLITLNRSNCGATYIDDGMIIRKWSKRNLPDHDDLTDLSGQDATETYIDRDSKTSLAFQGFLLYVFAVLLLL